MTSATTPLPFKAAVSLHRFSVDTYEGIIRAGVLTDLDKCELLEGYIVWKPPIDAPHEFATTALFRRLEHLVPAGWTVRSQVGTRLSESRPEPDVAVARGTDRDYAARHPQPADLGLVVEVSESSLDRDQQDKTRIYARDRVPVYWVVNMVDRRVEVYTDPNGPGDDPRYHTLRVFAAGSDVPVELDRVTVGTVAVNDILP